MQGKILRIEQHHVALETRCSDVHVACNFGIGGAALLSTFRVYCFTYSQLHIERNTTQSPGRRGGVIQSNFRSGCQTPRARTKERPPVGAVRAVRAEGAGSAEDAEHERRGHVQYLYNM